MAEKRYSLLAGKEVETTGAIAQPDALPPLLARRMVAAANAERDKAIEAQHRAEVELDALRAQVRPDLQAVSEKIESLQRVATDESRERVRAAENEAREERSRREAAERARDEALQAHQAITRDHEEAERRVADLQATVTQLRADLASAQAPKPAPVVAPVVEKKKPKPAAYDLTVTGHDSSGRPTQLRVVAV